MRKNSIAIAISLIIAVSCLVIFGSGMKKNAGSGNAECCKQKSGPSASQPIWESFPRQFI